MESSVNIGAPNQSLDTQATVGWDEYEYLKEQIKGMATLFSDYYDALYFDRITEIERPDVTMYRIAEITESLMRYGMQMSETQLATLLSKIREKVSSGTAL